MTFPLGTFPTQVGLCGRWWSTGWAKNKHHLWCLLIKKTKRNLSVSDSENKTADFPRFIVIESLKEVYLAKFSPFLIEKVLLFLSFCFLLPLLLYLLYLFLLVWGLVVLQIYCFLYKLNIFLLFAMCLLTLAFNLL